MILFAAPPEKYGLLPRELQALEYEIKGGGDISEFVTRLRDARHYAQIIVDVALFPKNTPDELVQGLYLLKSSNPTNLTILAQGMGNDKLLDGLIRLGVYNLVVSYGAERARRELAACLAGARTYEDVRDYTREEDPGANRKKPLPRQSVCVAGICPRIGTTTQAVRLVRSRTQTGYDACLVERDESCFEIIRDVFLEVRERSRNEYIYSGVPICGEYTPDVDARYNCFIQDTGVFSAENLGVYKKADRLVLVAGSKAWEILRLPAIQETIKDCADVSYIFSFTSPEEQNELMDFMGEAWHSTLFASYSPDPFAPLSPEDCAAYEKLFRKVRQPKFLLPFVGKGKAVHALA